MFRLKLLGGVTCEQLDGTEVDALYAQPKRLSLLAYLSAHSSGRYHRRDRLLAMFWPELDEGRGRDALSSALGFLRRTLGPQALLTRGSDDVAVSSQHVRCDVADLRDALRRHDVFDALRIYRGEFLDCLHVRGSTTFEDWAADLRRELRTAVAVAARVEATRREDAGDHASAANMARRALALSVDDERTVRDMLLLLDRVGERAGALFAYRSFADRLKRDFDAEPSPHTVAISLRLRRTAV